MVNSRFVTLILPFILGLLSSCGPRFEKKSLPTFSPFLLQNKIESNRPQGQGWDHYVAVVKLKGTPLFAEDNEMRAQKIEKMNLEQKETLAKLKEISSDIHVIYHYRFVLNGMALLIPKSVEEKVSKLGGIDFVEKDGPFVMDDGTRRRTLFPYTAPLEEANTTHFIEAKKIHQTLFALGTDQKNVPVDGRGMKIGIIDSGIDYTHKMLGGSGDPEDFKKVDPAKPSPLFPNQKVVGGFDFVGSDFDTSAGKFENHIPQPDCNPIDEKGHGTPVASVVAGIGDNVHSYSGVAPEAELYALKVFGKDGTTGDVAVLAALEYAADPNGDSDPKDKLDVLNISLGSPFGQPHKLYQEAIKNLVRAGTIVVAAAGNDGNQEHAVASPSTTEEAISVAASVDSMEHNWKFPAVKFRNQLGQKYIAEAIEGPISLPILEAQNVQEELVYLPLGAIKSPDELKNLAKGKVLLLDRGQETYTQMLKAALSLGAVAVIVANNQPGEPRAMFPSKTGFSVPIPAVMIAMELGNILKRDLEKGAIHVSFDSFMERPELIDTLTDGSSRGPRFGDALLKPEIAAPGLNIISADMGSGDQTSMKSGTSVAAPHIAGVVALIRQYRPRLTPLEIKSLIMSTAKSLRRPDGESYPISLQGAGRVQAYKAATSPLLFSVPAISLGEIQVEYAVARRTDIKIKNLSNKAMELNIRTQTHPRLQITLPTEVSLAPDETITLRPNIVVASPNTNSSSEELSGLILFSRGNDEVARLPVIGLIRKLSNIRATSLVARVLDPQAEPVVPFPVELQLKNSGKHPGDALIFNLLGQDGRKPLLDGSGQNQLLNCDLESAGFRVVEGRRDLDTAEDQDQEKTQVLQVAVKLYNPVSTWKPCEISVLIDSDGDEVADQELVGVTRSSLKGVVGPRESPYDFYSFLLNARKARDIRLKFESDLNLGNSNSAGKEDYREAIIDTREMKLYNHSTISIIEADLSKLARKKDGSLSVKVMVSNEDRHAIEADDFIAQGLSRWISIRPEKNEMAFSGMPEQVRLEAESEQHISFWKGAGKEDLVVYYPHNRTMSNIRRDDQAEIFHDIELILPEEKRK